MEKFNTRRIGSRRFTKTLCFIILIYAIPYECLVQANDRTCALCGKPLGQKWVVLDNREFHPGCAQKQLAKQRPVCGICGKPIAGEYAYDEKGKYHPACYKAHKLPRCSVCLKPIEGKYIRDPWNNIAHEKHGKQPTRLCSSCNRIISKSTSNGGYTYPDGRIVCGYCRRTAVDTQKDIQRSLKTVKKHLHAAGISPLPDDVPIHLVDKSFMKKKKNSANPKGFTLCELNYKNSRLVSRKQTVYILNGLPKTEFEGVLAHEFVHVWLNQNSITMSDSKTEGFCNLGTMLIYEADKSALSRVLLENMEKDPHPEYGKGYRRMKKKLGKIGWPKLIHNIKTGKP